MPVRKGEWSQINKPQPPPSEIRKTKDKLNSK